jgi:hypothetical protein
MNDEDRFISKMRPFLLLSKRWLRIESLRDEKARASGFTCFHVFSTAAISSRILLWRVLPRLLSGQINFHALSH